LTYFIAPKRMISLYVSLWKTSRLARPMKKPCWDDLSPLYFAILFRSADVRVCFPRELCRVNVRKGLFTRRMCPDFPMLAVPSPLSTVLSSSCLILCLLLFRFGAVSLEEITLCLLILISFTPAPPFFFFSFCR